jgi:PIN domain nuclease of toxin-antitoxin system
MATAAARRVVLDAYPLLAFLRDEPCAAEVGEIIAAGSSVTSSVTVAEAADVLVRVHGEDPGRVGATLGSLLADLVSVEAPDVEVGTRAGLLRARAYRRHREISLGDCFVVAAARRGDVIATADPLLAVLAREEGLDVLALPDSSGRRPA